MRLSKLWLALLGLLLSLSAAYAAIPNNDHPTTFIGPTFRGGFTSTFSDNGAYSLLGELGVKNYRMGGTVGWKFLTNQRIKFSAEYLWQRYSFAFFSGNTTEWVNQGAVGGAYRYDFLGIMFNPAVDVDAYYSHANNQTLNPRTQTFVNSLGITELFTEYRRIAGSNAFGINPGVSMVPWCGSRVGLQLNYDNVRYDKHTAPSEDAKGFGGTFKFRQNVWNNVDFGLLAAVRKPFNNYQADIGFRNLQFHGTWDLGLFGGYVAGKNTLSNTWNVGFSAYYLLDQRCHHVKANYKDYKDEIEHVADPDDLLAWVSDPAVYMPQVLAIPDSRVIIHRGCSAPIPVVIGAIDPVLFTISGVQIRQAKPAFSPTTGLTYAVSVTPNPAPSTVTINPVTGLITINGVQTLQTRTFNVTVIATNICGASAATTFAVTVQNPQ